MRRPAEPAELAPCSKGADQNQGPSPISGEPTAFTATIAATMWPARGHRAGRAQAALHRRRGRARACAHGASANGSALGREGGGVAKVAIGREPAPVLVAAICQIENDRLRHQRDQRAAQPRPRPCSRSAACTPPAASSPKAEPPDSTIASTAGTGVISGASNAVSRLPGAPPRMLTEATAG